VFVSIKPLHVSVFFLDHLQRVFRGSLCHYFSSCWFAFVRFCIIMQYVAACVCHLCVFGVLVCWWSACDHKQITNKQEHQTRHTRSATYCVIIQTQRTQFSRRNSNGTKHSGGTPEDGRDKRPKHVVVLYLQIRF
jgi:hypothetical protein